MHILVSVFDTCVVLVIKMGLILFCSDLSKVGFQANVAEGLVVLYGHREQLRILLGVEVLLLRGKNFAINVVSDLGRELLQNDGGAFDIPSS